MEALEQFRSEFSAHSAAQVRELIQTDKQFRQRLETLYERVFHKKLNKGCSNCWLDAFILLRSKSIHNLTTMAKRNFELKAGVVLRDVVNHDNAKLTTHHNLTDELAIYHLRTNPNCKSKFAKLPDDWEQRVAAATAAEEAPDTTADDATPTADDATAAEEAPDGDEKRSEMDSALKNAERVLKGAETKLKNAQETGDEKAIARAEAALAKASDKVAALKSEM